MATMNVLYATGDERRHLDTIFKRAATDADFRQQLLSEPRRAIEVATGVKLPNSYNIQFVETPPGVDAIVPLPDLIDEDVSLTEAELEAVAGGNDAEWCCGCTDCTAGCSQCTAVSGTETATY